MGSRNSFDREVTSLDLSGVSVFFEQDSKQATKAEVKAIKNAESIKRISYDGSWWNYVGSTAEAEDGGEYAGTIIHTESGAFEREYGEELFAKWFGVVADNGLDQGEQLQNYLNVLLASGKVGVLPSGSIRMESIARGDGDGGSQYPSGDLSIKSEGYTTFDMAAGSQRLLFIRVERKAQMNLSSDAAYMDMCVDVDNADGVAVGDMLRIENDQIPSPSRPYQKEHLRFVVSIELGGGVGGADRLHIDKPLVWFFKVSENTLVDAYAPTKLNLKNIGVKCELNGGVAFSYFSGGTIKNMNLQGPLKFYDTTTDPLLIGQSNGITIDGGYWQYFRYVNLSAVRDFVVKNQRVFGVRHIDFNTWSEDCRIEDVVGTWTQGLAQCHASLNISLARINDHIDKNTPDLAGLDLRCAGGSAEDVTVSCGHDAVDSATNGISLNEEYEYIYRHYPPRRLTRVDAPQWPVNARYCGELEIDGGRFHSLQQNGYEVDSVRIISVPKIIDKSANKVTAKIISNNQLPELEVFNSFGRKIGSSVVAITGITQSDSASVVAVGHGLNTGDVVQVNGVVGMVEINGLESIVTVVDADNFTLDAVDSADMSAYISGGVLTPMSEYSTVNVNHNIECSGKPVLKYIAKLLENVSMPDGEVSIPFKFIHDLGGGGGGFKNGVFRLIVNLRDDTGVFIIPFRTFKSGTSSIEFGVPTLEGSNLSGENIGVSISNAQAHYFTQKIEEDTTSAAENYYGLVQFDVVTDTNDYLNSVYLDCEFY